MAKISGNLSNDARIIIVKESDWSVESNTEKSSGAFEISDLASGNKTVISRSSSGECIGYGGVSAVEPPPPAEPDPILHIARFFGTDADGFVAGWASSWSGAKSLTTGGEYFDSQSNSDVAIQASKTDLGGNYEYLIGKSFFYFDLSDISSTGRTLQNVRLVFKTWTNAQSSVTAFEGTQGDILSLDDFDAHGSTAFSSSVTWTTAASAIWETFNLNSAGINYVNSKIGNIAKFCLRESSKDVDNVSPIGNNRNGLFFSEEFYPDLDFSSYHYYPGRPVIYLEYMKVPVWSVKLDQTYWEPWDEDSDSATWNGTGWAAGRWGSVDIQVKTGTTWNQDYKPIKMKVTFTGASGPVTLALFGTKNNSFYPYDPWEYGDVESGQEVILDWYWPDDNMFELYIDADVVITNIEFLER